MKKLIGYQVGCLILFASLTLQTAQAQEYIEPQAGAYSCFVSFDNFFDPNARYVFKLELLDGQRYLIGTQQRTAAATYRIKAVDQKNDPFSRLFPEASQIIFLDERNSLVMSGIYPVARNGRHYLLILFPLMKKTFFRCGKGNTHDDLGTTARPPARNNSSESREATRQRMPSTSSPSKNSAGLEGLYIRFGSEYKVSFNYMDGSPNVGPEPVAEYKFFKNGYVYEGIYPDGYNALDCTQRSKDGEPLCRAYSIQGNTIRIGTDKPVPFQRVRDGSNSIKIGDHEFQFEAPFNDLRLEGQFTFFDAMVSDSSSSGVSASVSASHSFLFHKDGSFSSERGGGTSNDVMTFSRRGASAGRYRIQGHTLELQFNNGKRERYVIVTGSDANTIYLNGSLFKRG